jgi:MFS family permease
VAGLRETDDANKVEQALPRREGPRIRVATERKRFFYGYYLAALSFFLGFTSGAIYLHTRGVLVRDQLVDFDASRTEISLAFTAVQAVGLIFAPILGGLLDRYSIRTVMAAGALWLGFGFFMMSQVVTVLQFAMAAALFVGLGTGAIGTTANTKLMVNWFDQRRGVALGVAIMGYSVAGIVMSPVALFLLDTIGWRSTYVVFGAACLLVALPAVLLIVKEGPWVVGTGADGSPVAQLAAPGRVAGGPAGEAYLSFLKSPPFWGAVLVFGLADGVFGGLNLHLFLHYTGLGIGDYQAALVLSWTAALGIISKPLFGGLADRIGARSATLAAFGCCSGAMLVFGQASTFPALLLAGGMFGIAFGGMVPLRAALLSRLFPISRFGRAYGSFRLCMFPMTLAWTPLIGIVYDRTGSYAPVFGVLAAAFVAASAIALALIPRETRGEPTGEHSIRVATRGAAEAPPPRPG